MSRAKTSLQLLGLFLVVSTVVALRPSVASLPLNRWPFVQVHDSATGYLQTSWLHPIDEIIYAWTKTQDGNVTQQLNCGARSFDWRPAVSNGSLFMHHGPVVIPYPMEKALVEIVEWAHQHSQDEDDLVLLDVSHCQGTNCYNVARQALVGAGIPIVGCDVITNITVADALRLGKLSNGPGHILAFQECQDTPPGWTTYDDTYECHGFVDLATDMKFRDQLNECLSHGSKSFLQRLRSVRSFGEMSLEDGEYLRSIPWNDVWACIQGVVEIFNSSSQYNCWGDNADFAYQRIFNFNKNLTSLPFPTAPHAYLWGPAGNWAQSIEDTVLGFLKGSSLLQDEVRSKFNQKYIEWVQTGQFINLPPASGVNNVCESGVQLNAALRQRALSQL